MSSEYAVLQRSIRHLFLDCFDVEHAVIADKGIRFVVVGVALFLTIAPSIIVRSLPDIKLPKGAIENFEVVMKDLKIGFGEGSLDIHLITYFCCRREPWSSFR